jgi:hypothetical protein
MPDYLVNWRQLDPDDEYSAASHACTLRIANRYMCVFANERAHLVEVGRWLPFHGPRLVQFLLTPLRAGSGMLLSKRDLAWIALNTSRPRLQITPCVPPDFFVELTFESKLDAASALEQISRLFNDK